MNHSNHGRRLLSAAAVVLGNAGYSLTVALFLEPAGLVAGGATGVALAFGRLTGLSVSGFLLAWQPAIFGNAWYGVTLLCVLVPLFFCLYGACRCVVRRLDQAQKLLPWALALLVCFAFIEGMPAPVEGLYWFNGAMNYLPYFSLAVLNAGLAFALCFADKLPTRRKFFYAAAGCVCSLVIGGGHQVAGLLNVLVLLLAAALCAVSRRNFWQVPALAAAMAGLLLNVLAPGTQVRTAGFAGADLENLMNEAAICAAKQNRQFIKKEDVDKCFVKIGIGGEKKSRLVPEKERKITAYHESGHAILFHLLSEVGPVHLVSIIPNGRGAGGYTMPLPENDNVFMTKKHMLQDIMVSFGGRIAEELIFGDITTGASADIKQATQTAQAMVVKYGMSEKVGLINYEVNSEEEVFLGRDLGHARNYSEKVATMIDKEVRRIMDECYQEAKLIIESHIDVLHRCAAALLEKERINRAEFEALFEVSPTETYPDGLDTTGLNL